MLRLSFRLVAGAAAIVFACVCYAWLTLPDVRPLATTNPSETAFMQLRAAQARADGRTPRRRQRWVAYNHLAPDLKRAVLVAEDDAFWEHDGVDLTQVRDAIELDVTRGRMVRGASTITQQLAKNLYLSPSKNPLRKLRELIIARRLEATLSKRRIFEIYLNVIEWGDGVYGVEAASETYFHKPASALTSDEAALLAGAIINPRLLNPTHPTRRLLRRRQIILRRMGTAEPPDVARAQP
jgi:monofunctional biosynthetic peptidoglycan transglycosylase